MGQNAVAKSVVETHARLGDRLVFEFLGSYRWKETYLGLKVHFVVISFATLFLIITRGSSRRRSFRSAVLARCDLNEDQNAEF